MYWQQRMHPVGKGCRPWVFHQLYPGAWSHVEFPHDVQPAMKRSSKPEEGKKKKLKSSSCLLSRSFWVLSGVVERAESGTWLPSPWWGRGAFPPWTLGCSLAKSSWEMLWIQFKPQDLPSVRSGLSRVPWKGLCETTQQGKVTMSQV